MATPQQTAEPSMEEILASIRRIISEDDAPKPAANEAPLDLAAQPALRAAAEPAPAKPNDSDFDDLMVFEDDPAPAPAPAPVPAPQPRAEPPRAARVPEPISEADEIVSAPAVSKAADSFTRLAGNLRVSEQPGQTLEGVVRDLLRPMLKEWLDSHLPEIVEAKVEAELDRISRLAR
jgi:cell pole-organizing protein PopZ